MSLGKEASMLLEWIVDGNTVHQTREAVCLLSTALSQCCWSAILHGVFRERHSLLGRVHQRALRKAQTSGKHNL